MKTEDVGVIDTEFDKVPDKLTVGQIWFNGKELFSYGPVYPVKRLNREQIKAIEEQMKKAGKL